MQDAEALAGLPQRSRPPCGLGWPKAWRGGQPGPTSWVLGIHRSPLSFLNKVAYELWKNLAGSETDSQLHANAGRTGSGNCTRMAGNRLAIAQRMHANARKARNARKCTQSGQMQPRVAFRAGETPFFETQIWAQEKGFPRPKLQKLPPEAARAAVSAVPPATWPASRAQFSARVMSCNGVSAGHHLCRVTGGLVHGVSKCPSLMQDRVALTTSGVRSLISPRAWLPGGFASSVDEIAALPDGGAPRRGAWLRAQLQA